MLVPIEGPEKKSTMYIDPAEVSLCLYEWQSSKMTICLKGTQVSVITRLSGVEEYNRISAEIYGEAKKCGENYDSKKWIK